MIKPFSMVLNGYKLELTQFGFRLYRTRKLEIWEGAIAFVELGVSPVTWERIDPESQIEVLKGFLWHFKTLPKADRKKISCRGIDSVLRAIKPDLNYCQILQVKKEFNLI